MALRFLSGGGEMGERMRAHDWGATPLGDPRGWPSPLKTIVGVMLAAAQPMFAAWGPARVMLYNDGYAEVLGGKHPSALGRPFAEVWHEILGEVGPLMDRAYAGEPTSMDRMRLTMMRHGYPEETYFTFSYSPIRGEDGEVGGVFCACQEITGQVIAEHARVAEMDQLRRLFEQTPSFMAVLSGPEHRFEFANRSYLDLIGRSEVAGMRVADALPGIAEQGYIAMLDRVRAEGRVHVGRSTSVLLQRVPGRPPEERILDFIFQPMPNASGAITSIFVEGVDVTEARRAETQLREREGFLSAIIGQAAAGISLSLPDGTLTFVNDRCCEILGTPREALLGRRLQNVAHPEDREAEQAVFEALQAGGPPITVERRYLRPGGSVVWVRNSVTAIRDAAGTITDVIVVSVDVSDRHAAEAALREMNIHLERRVADRTGEVNRLWRSSQDLLAVLAPDGTFRAVNPAWKTILGLDPDGLVGQPLLSFVWEEDREASRDALRRSSQGVLRHFENRFRHRDGDFRWIAWAAAPDEAGRVYATGRDITAEREAKEALAVAEEALRQSQKMESLGQLTGGIAHDFNNLLTGIIGALDIMRRRIEAGRSGELARYMDAASSAAQRAASLTHRLLAFARRQSLDSRPVDVNALVAGMEELLRRTLGEQIGLVTAPNPDLWPALTDANQLESAILNLAINARDAMPDGGHLYIATAPETLPATKDLAAGDYVAIRVSDTGMGMSPDVLTKAFDPFFTTKPIGQGTGLGLSMIYGFAKQSRGHIRVQSAPGRGTAFTLLLPRAAVADEEEAAPEGAAPQGQGETVLVVEDDATVRLLVTEVLDELGYRYLEAADARDAIPILQSRQRIDLMISDVGLPGMNGRQLAEVARAARPRLRVLFVTGYAENATMRSGFLAPGMEMMTKPFALAALGTKIRAMLEAD
ncbi:PAS domain-containing protein [Roseomonas xinghualingensis]|uniref:PAS domain-containing protein n=1 Tax=Roseomonas xinghualingensis TaxID=2986475 RepID=UPI0021F21629|nr:PAS domain-containing protein [Roseomonas sp. SXEYE001]MCV4207656.1 PAS domain-containing protein [Roseomonas sp. SXEYE001]